MTLLSRNTGCGLVLRIALSLGFVTGVSGQALRFTEPPALSVGGNSLLKVSGPVGQVVEVQVSTNLTDWITLAIVTNETGLVQAMDPNAGQHPQRFYRAAPAVLEVFPLPDFVKINAGTFLMGNPEQTTAGDREFQHQVTLTRDFYMSQYEVTQAQYLEVMGSNPSYFTSISEPGLNRPVEQVKWIDATNYCWKLTQAERAARHLPEGWVYRLPTEAEWEYACRAGTTTAFHYGPELRSGMANFSGTEEYVEGIGQVYNPYGLVLNRTTTVGSYAPNAYGLYDMHGNVWEWVLDLAGSYPTNSVIDPTGPTSNSNGANRSRGGGYSNYGSYCRSATRGGYPSADHSYRNLGFRPVLGQIP